MDPRPERAAAVARVLTATLVGLGARRVRVEADVSAALPGFSLVGLPSAALRESRERVGAALRNAGFRWPEGRITVSLAPADLRKDGAAMDLAVATSLLLASGQLPRPAGDWLRRTLFVGELALDGALRPTRGVVALALDAIELGIDRIVVARAQLAELEEVEEVEVLALDHLRELPLLLRRPIPVRRSAAPPGEDGFEAALVALREVRGQARAKRALALAVAGGHHLLLHGPPGCGKSMLARRLAALLPGLDRARSRERRRIASAAGMGLSASEALRPPLRAPHHSLTAAGLIGGGRPLRPGEVTLAHRGVLLLDELPEFRRDRLDLLREPLESGAINLNRAGETIRWPARFQLVATANPCPCGWWGSRLDRCRCPDRVVEQYQRRLSGPLRDRIDLWLDIDRESADAFVHTEEPSDENEVELFRRARAIREKALDRPNGRLEREELRNRCLSRPQTRRLAQDLADRRALSLRALASVLRVARTLADLEAEEEVRRGHLAEAFTYRRPFEEGQSS